MPSQRRRTTALAILLLGICLVVCAAARAQSGGSTDAAKAPQAKTTILGCLERTETRQFALYDEDGDEYRLAGRTAGLASHVGEEVRIAGTLSPRVSDTQDQTLRIARLTTVYKTHKPQMSPEFTDAAHWRTEANHEFGLALALPRSVTGSFTPHVLDPDGNQPGANFLLASSGKKLASFDIPESAYPDSSFGGGSLTVYVHPAIASAGNCRQFGSFDPADTDSRRLGSVEYASTSENSAGMGHGYVTTYYHAFQHGFCYGFAFDSEVNHTDYHDRLGCAVSPLDDDEYARPVEAILSHISFSTPEAKPPVAVQSTAAPVVAAFGKSPETRPDRGSTNVTLSWAVENADFVRFDYHCIAPASVLIMEPGSRRYCEEQSDRSDSFVTNQPTQASMRFTVIDVLLKTPLPITVTLTPWRDGKPYPESSKSLTIHIGPNGEDNRK